MSRHLALALLLSPLLALAQPAPEAAPLTAPPLASMPEPVHAAVPIEKDWNIGAGLGLSVLGPGYSQPGLASLLGGLGTVQSSSSVGAAVQPRFTVLLERRVADRLFLTFQGSVSYGASQDDLDAELKGHQFDVSGALGVRRVFNPHGVVEVSWFGSAGIAYSNSESRAIGSTYDSTTGTFSATELTIFRSHSFSVGATTGLALERELIEGLALRLSSSILGLSYGLGASTATAPDSRIDRQSHQIDVGLRFSPSIELRYAL